MKNLNATSYILSAVLAFSLTSCEKEKPLDEAIISKWEVVTLTQITYENNIKKSEIILYYEAGERAYQFVDGGSGIYFENADDFLFSWTIAGSVLTISNLYEQALVVDASIDGNTLTWSYTAPDPEDATKSYKYILRARRIS